jgi:hypothetical protein
MQSESRKWLSKLANPFLLVAEGFVLGAILLGGSSPALLDPRPSRPPAPLDSSIIPNPAR